MVLSQCATNSRTRTSRTAYSDSIIETLFKKHAEIRFSQCCDILSSFETQFGAMKVLVFLKTTFDSLEERSSNELLEVELEDQELLSRNADPLGSKCNLCGRWALRPPNQSRPAIALVAGNCKMTRALWTEQLLLPLPIDHVLRSLVRTSFQIRIGLARNCIYLAL